MGKRKASLVGNLADVDLRLLRIFKIIVEQGGIAAAELELNIAISTISNHLADLERRLQMTLCERGRKGFKVTPQGQLVYNATLELLAALEQFQSSIHQTQETLVGTLNLGIEEFCLFSCEQILAAAIERFTNIAPEVYINIHTFAADKVSQAVTSEVVAIGITALPAPMKNLTALPLGVSETMKLYCGEKHVLYKKPDRQITLGELGRQKYIETHKMRPGRMLIPEAEKWYRQASALQYEARALLIHSGNFIGYLSKEYVEHMGWQEQMRPLQKRGLNYSNNYAAIVGKHAGQSPVNQAFFECLNEQTSS